MISIPEIQENLTRLNIDGWLFVNHHSLDPIAIQLLALDPTRMASRRWWFFIPRAGEPVKLVHSVETHVLDHLPGETRMYSTYRSLNEQIERFLGGGKTVAMQYSPRAELPMISLVDAGTVEVVRGFGAVVVSSADLLQRHFSQLDDEQMKTHAEASKLVYAIKDEAFDLIHRQSKTATQLTDRGVQQYILSRFEEMGLTCDGTPPIVAINENAADPHFALDQYRETPIRVGDRILIDLWARLNQERSVYADICWCAFVGATPPKAYERLFELAVAARDEAVAFLRRRCSQGAPTTGAEVDRAARAVFERNGVAQLSLHRTGHSIDTSVHGRGANIDSYETNDTRKIIPRTCFSIEPALYDFPIGVRSEIDVIVDAKNSVLVFGEKQDSIVLLS